MGTDLQLDVALLAWWAIVFVEIMLLHGYFLSANLFVLLVVKFIDDSLGWGAFTLFKVVTVVDRVLSWLSILVVVKSAPSGCLSERCVWLMLVKAQLVGDSGVGTDVRPLDFDMHVGVLEVLRFDRKALFELIKLFLSKRSLQLWLSRRLWHPDNLANRHVLRSLEVSHATLFIGALWDAFDDDFWVD